MTQNRTLRVSRSFNGQGPCPEVARPSPETALPALGRCQGGPEVISALPSPYRAIVAKVVIRPTSGLSIVDHAHGRARITYGTH